MTIDDKQLSVHFKLSELTVTQVRQYVEINSEQAQQYMDSLTKVCVELLEPIRQKFGAIKVDSGFRCVDLNKAIGGSLTSQHTLGMAADIIQLAKPTYDGCVEMWKWAKDNLQYHQLLLEHGCLHVSLITGTNDMQALFAEPSETNPNVWIKKPYQG